MAATTLSLSIGSEVGTLSTERRRTLFISLLLFLATLLLYTPALKNGFVNYDDPDYVTSNPRVLQGLSWSNVRWAMTATVQANWHPLTWMSHMLDVQLFGLDPHGHHLHNILLHGCNVVLLFLLFRKVTGAAWRSALVAALFAVHPLNVECVAWIAERKSLLAMLFLLLTFLAYNWYVRKRSLVRYTLVLVLFALGLAAKPMVVTLPLLLLLWDYWPLGRASTESVSESGLSWTYLVVEKVPLFFLSAASACVTVYAQANGGALGNTQALPLSQRFDNAIVSYLVYVLKGLWPSRLAVFYPHPEGSLPLWKVFCAAFVLVVLTALVWHFRKNRRWLLVGWLWYLVAMLPMIGIMQVGRQAMADRYAYLPFIGLFVIGVWAAAECLEGLEATDSLKATIAMATLIAYASLTFVQIGYWRDGYTLFTHALEVTERNGVTEANLATTLIEMGRPDLATPHLEAAEKFTPQLATPHYDLAVIRQEQGKVEIAKEEYEATLKYSGDPNQLLHAHHNLAFLLLALNDLPGAEREFTAALQMSPDKQNSLLGRGMVEFREGKMDAALADLTRASQISPSDTAQFWLGRTYEALGDRAAATLAYQAALQMTPDMRDAQEGLQRVSGEQARAQSEKSGATGFKRR